MRTGSRQQNAIGPCGVGDVSAVGHQQRRSPPQQLLRPAPSRRRLSCTIREGRLPCPALLPCRCRRYWTPVPCRTNKHPPISTHRHRGRLCSLDGVIAEKSQPVPVTTDLCVVAEPCLGKRGPLHCQHTDTGGGCGMRRACAGCRKLKPMWCHSHAYALSSPAIALGGLATAQQLAGAEHVLGKRVQAGASPCNAICVKDQRA